MFTENIFFQNIYGKDKYEILETIGKELKAKEIVIEAQTYVKSLYEQLGFRVESEEFFEDGIPHVQMRLML